MLGQNVQRAWLCVSTPKNCIDIAAYLSKCLVCRETDAGRAQVVRKGEDAERMEKRLVVEIAMAATSKTVWQRCDGKEEIACRNEEGRVDT